MCQIIRQKVGQIIRQFTVAVESGKHIGVDLPSGKGRVRIPLVLEGEFPNPAALEQQLIDRGLKPTYRGPNEFVGK